MIQIDNKIISLDIFENHFACDLNSCKGACCVEGDSGAPLLLAEKNILEETYSKIKPYMRKEGVDVVAMGFLKKLNMDISVKKENFLEALELNFQRIEDAEEFELCQKATEWMDILRSESEKES